MLTILVCAALSLPPSPLNVRSPVLSPKLAEMKSSLGTPMSKVIASPPAIVTAPIQGFVITNIAVSGNNVSLSWQQGTPVFQVQGSPTLPSQWINIGRLSTAQNKTFPVDQNRFFRVIGSNLMLLSITHTNPTTLTWDKPDTDMSDSLEPFTVQRATDGVNFSTITPTAPQVNPVPVNGQPAGAPGAGTLTLTDPITIQPGQVFTYRLLETTANGVVVPYNMPVANPSNPVYPGWPKPIGGTGTDAGAAVAVDSLGNIYVVGTFATTVDFSAGVSPSTGTLIAKGQRPTFPADMFIAKYTSIGTLVWVKGFGYNDGGTFSSVMDPRSIALDANGNIFVGGSFTGIENFGGVNHASLMTGGAYTADIFLVKYDSQGNWKWDLVAGSTVVTGPGRSGGDDFVNSVAVDSQGAVYIAGSCYGSLPFLPDPSPRQVITTFLAKLSNLDGSVVWGQGSSDWNISSAQNGAVRILIDKRIDSGTGQPFDTIYLMGVATPGCIIQLPNHTINSGSANNCYLIKFAKSVSSLGADLWAFMTGSTTTLPTTASTDLSIDPFTGNVGMVGSFQKQTNLGGGSVSNSAPSTAFLSMYSSLDGSWLRQVFILLPAQTGFASLAFDSVGRALVVGTFQGDCPPFGTTTNLGGNAFVARYSPSGATFNLDWHETFSTLGFSSFSAIKVDASDFAVTTGKFTGTLSGQSSTMSSGGGQDIIITRLNQ